MNGVALGLRIQRFEFLAVGIVGSLLTLAALGITAQLTALHVPLACFGTPDVHGATLSSAPGCLDLLTAFSTINGDEADRFFAVLIGFPVVAGVLVGVPIVSREIEQGTAVLPWTLSGRRRRWLLRRVAVAIGVLLVALVPLALAADGLEAARNPLVAANQSFGSEALRGGVLVARGLAGLGLGVVIGLVVGRQLPAVILGLVAAVLLVLGDLEAGGAWDRGVAQYVPQAEARLGDLSLVAALRSKTDASIVSQRDIVKLIPPRSDLPPGAIDDQWVALHYDEVLLIVPGSRYKDSVLVRSAGLGLVAWAGLGLALVLVERRRVR